MLYFAYGSNLSIQRLTARIGKVIKVRNYVLKDFKLVFDTGYKSTYANIIPKKGEQVEGVIFHISELQAYLLDEYEGYPFIYIRKNFRLPDGRKVMYYSGVMTRFSGQPTISYLKEILTGCIEHGLEKTATQIEDLMTKIWKKYAHYR